MGWSNKWEDVSVSEETKENQLLENFKNKITKNSPEFIKKCNADFDKELGAPLKKEITKIGEALKEIVETKLYDVNTILTFECAECGQEFNCNTTKFGVLCDKAAIAGWKMKFKEIGYDCYCPIHKE